MMVPVPSLVDYYGVIAKESLEERNKLFRNKHFKVCEIKEKENRK